MAGFALGLIDSFQYSVAASPAISSVGCSIKASGATSTSWRRSASWWNADLFVRNETPRSGEEGKREGNEHSSIDSWFNRSPKYPALYDNPTGAEGELRTLNSDRGAKRVFVAQTFSVQCSKFNVRSSGSKRRFLRTELPPGGGINKGTRPPTTPAASGSHS